MNGPQSNQAQSAMTPFYFGNSKTPRENEAVGDFVSRIIWGVPKRISDYCAMGVFHHNALVAGTLYHNWHPDDGVIELSSGTTTPRWLTRPVIKAMFRLPFDILGARLTVLRVSEHNAGMRKIAHRFGFQETIIPRLRGADEAECVYTLSRNEWQSHGMNT